MSTVSLFQPSSATQTRNLTALSVAQGAPGSSGANLANSLVSTTNNSTAQRTTVTTSPLTVSNAVQQQAAQRTTTTTTTTTPTASNPATTPSGLNPSLISQFGVAQFIGFQNSGLVFANGQTTAVTPQQAVAQTPAPQPNPTTTPTTNPPPPRGGGDDDDDRDGRGGVRGRGRDDDRDRGRRVGRGGQRGGDDIRAQLSAQSSDNGITINANIRAGNFRESLSISVIGFNGQSGGGNGGSLSLNLSLSSGNRGFSSQIGLNTSRGGQQLGLNFNFNT